jgi:positive regulator of sigma E activity
MTTATGWVSTYLQLINIIIIIIIIIIIMADVKSLTGYANLRRSTNERKWDPIILTIFTIHKCIFTYL